MYATAPYIEHIYPTPFQINHISYEYLYLYIASKYAK